MNRLARVLPLYISVWAGCVGSVEPAEDGEDPLGPESPAPRGTGTAGPGAPAPGGAPEGMPGATVPPNPAATGPCGPPARRIWKLTPDQYTSTVNAILPKVGDPGEALQGSLSLQGR